MQNINFLNEYYKNKVLDQNSADLINMFLEEDKNRGKYPVIALPTPGTTVFSSGVSGSVVRAMLEHKDVLYVVIDNKLYVFNSGGTATQLGTISSSSGDVEMAFISNQIMVLDIAGSGAGYIYNESTLTFSQIVDADFPTNGVSLIAQDEYFLVNISNSTFWYASDVGDGTSWNALSFSSKIGAGDYLQRLTSYKQQIWLFGTYTTEIWYNSGATTFSFDPVPGSFIHYGCAAPRSVALGNNALYLLAQSRSGGKTIIMYNESYQPTVIANRAILYQINQLTSTSDAFGYCYQQGGHEFYVLTFPSDEKTFVYDLTTEIWHERQSTISDVRTRHISNCYAYAFNKHLIGAFNSGIIYQMSDTTYTENGVSIYRQVTTSPAFNNGDRLFFDKLELDLRTGTGLGMQVDLLVSKDSGNSFGSVYTLTMPATGIRLLYNRLGSTVGAFVLRFRATTDYEFAILGASGQFRQGIS